MQAAEDINETPEHPELLGCPRSHFSESSLLTWSAEGSATVENKIIPCISPTGAVNVPEQEPIAGANVPKVLRTNADQARLSAQMRG